MKSITVIDRCVTMGQTPNIIAYYADRGHMTPSPGIPLPVLSVHGSKQLFLYMNHTTPGDTSCLTHVAKAKGTSPALFACVRFPLTAAR